MRRETARVIHEIVGSTFWMENPQWQPNGRLKNTGCRLVRGLPFSLHELLNRAAFNSDKILAVSSESVVARSDDSGKVDKFMFRYPGKMPIGTFRERVSTEVTAMTEALAGIALPTTVSIKPATIFRNPNTQVLAVTQTQPYLDTDEHTALDVPSLMNHGTSPALDKTAQDLDSLLICIDLLSVQHSFIPDIAHCSGNLRRSTTDGSITLIDVMPGYIDGNRLIDDNPDGIISGFEENLLHIQDFVGQYGS